jgi:hypothetical protein
VKGIGSPRFVVLLINLLLSDEESAADQVEVTMDRPFND